MPKQDTILFAFTDFDYPTKLSRQALMHSVDYGKRLGLNIIVVDDFTRETLENAIQSFDPKMIVAMGHGDIDILTGDNKVPVYQPCNTQSLANRMVYFHSCNTAAILGKDIASKGAESFTGSTEEFVWTQLFPTDPMDDPYGKAFFEPTILFIDALLSGATLDEAISIALEKYNYWIDRWSKTPEPIAPLIISLLIQDRDSFVTYGNLNAKATTLEFTGIQEEKMSLTRLLILLPAAFLTIKKAS